MTVGVGFGGMALMHAARAAFNTEVPWADVLEPHGWRRNGDPATDGTQEWTRPHSSEAKQVNARSATTDWNGAPHSMSLLSESPATGLSHLGSTRVRLDKARVAAELEHGGDMAALLTEFLSDKRESASMTTTPEPKRSRGPVLGGHRRRRSHRLRCRPRPPTRSRTRS